MTPEQIEQHRKRFEDFMVATNDWAKKDLMMCNGRYVDWLVDGMFKGYLLCAENLEVELPKRPSHSDFRSSYEQGCDDGAESMLDDCIAMLESQGIKVKP